MMCMGCRRLRLSPKLMVQEDAREMNKDAKRDDVAIEHEKNSKRNKGNTSKDGRPTTSKTVE